MFFAVNQRARRSCGEPKGQAKLLWRCPSGRDCWTALTLDPCAWATACLLLTGRSSAAQYYSGCSLAGWRRRQVKLKSHPACASR